MKAKVIARKGRKATLGRAMFDNGRLAFFVGYHKCEECGAKSKMLLSVEEAREFARRVGSTREPLRIRIMRRLMRKYEI